MEIESGLNIFRKIRYSLWPLAALLFLLSVQGRAASTLDYSLWKHSAKIYFNTTSTGALTVTDLENYPVLLRLNNSFQIMSQSLPGGADIRFADPDGRHLAYQIERWDGNLGKSEIWVKVPGITANSKTDYIVVYWGKPEATTASNGMEVFPATNGFVGVWHLGENSTSLRANAVGANNPAKPMQYNGDESVAGLIGKADSLDGATAGDHLELGAMNFDFSKAITISFWIYSTAVGKWETFMDLGSGDPKDNIYVSRRDIAPDFQIEVFNGTASQGVFTALNALEPKKWTYAALTLSGLDMTFYVNGLRVQSGKLKAAPINIARLNNFIGRSNWVADKFLTGIIDEPTLSTVARSGDWIKLAYESQKADAKWLTMEAPVDAKLSILTQPLSQSVLAGFPASFTVLAHSGKTIAYQWFREGKNIAGATNPTLTIPVVTESDIGFYICELRDGADLLATIPATLKLPENFAQWGRSMRIVCNTTHQPRLDSTLNGTGTTNIGADIKSNLTNFPLLIRLSENNFDFTEALTDGADIRFTDPQGNPLDYEIETWDSQKKLAALWVRVPEVKGNSNAHTLTMLWKKKGVTSTANSSAVFRGSEGYRGVWHLNEMGITNAQDAVSREYSGIVKEAKGGTPGVVGGAFRFNGGTSHIEIPLLATSGLKGLSFSLWVQETTPTTAAMLHLAPTLLGVSIDPQATNDLGIVSNGGFLGVWHGLDSLDDKGSLTTLKLNDGKWHHVALTYSGTKVTLYEGGVKRAELAAGNRPLAAYAFALGSSHFPGETYPGSITGDVDDLGISGNIWSEDWIKFSYESQRLDGQSIGYANPVDLPPFDTVITPPIGPNPKSDTLIKAGTFLLDAMHAIQYPIQTINAPVLVFKGQEWSQLPAGFDSVGNRFRIDATDPRLGFPKLTLTGFDGKTGLALFRQNTDGSISWVSKYDQGFSLGTAGNYFWARDTAAPSIRFLTAFPVGQDSMEVTFHYEDNVKNLSSMLRFWNGKLDSTGWKSAEVQVDQVFYLTLPQTAPVPLEIQLEINDQSNWNFFPHESRTYTLPQNLPAFSKPLVLKPGYAWRLAGFPLDPLTPISINQLGGQGKAIAAVWNPVKTDSEYVLLKEEEILPAGKGFWLASLKGLNSISLPVSRSVASDTDGEFSLALVHGWNLVTCPTFRALGWPSSRQNQSAYMQADLKGLWSFDGTEYQFADSLEPWNGYYVYHNGNDTLIRIGSRSQAGLKSTAGLKANAGLKTTAGLITRSSSAALPWAEVTQEIQTSLILGSGSTHKLRLGSAGFARSSIGTEDERMPPARDRTLSRNNIWLERAGQALASDFIAAEAKQVLRWTVVSERKHSSYSLDVLASQLPPRFEAWALTPSRLMKYQMALGQKIPMFGTDTLLILAGTPEQLALLPEWQASRVKPPDFSQRVRNGLTGIEVEMSLPTAAHLLIRVWSVRGRQLGQWDVGEVGEGRHAWILPNSDLPGHRTQGVFLVEISLMGQGWRSHKTFKTGPAP